MEIPLLTEIVIILGLSVVSVLILKRLHLPTILAYILTGILAGPHGLRFINDSASHEVEVLSEIGVILLLFIIGMEFSLKSLAAIRNSVLIGGATQVFGTTLIVLGLGLGFGMDWQHALFAGFLFSLSSTAIVLKILQDQGEVNSPHGKTILAILIFQDIIVVPMMIFTPLIAGEAEDIWITLLILGLKGIFVVIFVIVTARYVVPWLLFQIARTKSQELFILAVVMICFSVAWLSSYLGLSLALGAFLAGLIISESEYSHQATSQIIPFKEIFTGFFFVSIGMLLDASFLWQNLWMVLLLTLGTFLIKATIAGLASVFLKYPLRTVLLVGFSLFQVGEFAFILSRVGLDYNLVDDQFYQYFLSVSLVTMSLTPFVIKFARNMADALLQNKLGAKISSNYNARVSAGTSPKESEEQVNLNDHLIIIGFGINGKNLARVAKKTSIPYVIFEINAETVRTYKAKGEPIIYGDPTQAFHLEHVDVHKARVVVIAISDPVATKRILKNLREISERVHVIVRTRFVKEMEELYKMGADEVIPEEFETSIEIFNRVLHKYMLPIHQIQEYTRKIRSSSYEMFRDMPGSSLSSNFQSLDHELSALEVATIKVGNQACDVINKSMKDSGLRNKYKINVVAIKRGNDLILDVDGNTKILIDDHLYVVGQMDHINTFNDTVCVGSLVNKN